MIDPVCGMEVTPEDAAGSYQYQGQQFYFCNESCLEQFQANPEAFLAPPSEPHHDAGSGSRRHLHLPDGSGGPPARPRRVSQVRHGARTPYRHAGRGNQPGTPPHDAAILDQPGADGAADRHGNVSHARGAIPRARHSPEAACLDRVGSCHSGGPLGRLAFLPARLGIGRQPQPQHVHAHRHGHGHGLPLQRSRHGLSRKFSRHLSGSPPAKSRCISSPPPQLRRWFFWGKCWSYARAAAPAAR